MSRSRRRLGPREWTLALAVLAGCAAATPAPLDAASAGADCSSLPVVPPVDAIHDLLRISKPFGAASHRGEDWTDSSPSSTALGAPVHSVAAGVVVFAGNADRDGYSGWGNVVIVRHRIPHGAPRPDEEVESLYGHLESVTVRAGQQLCASRVVGTIGTGEGRYAPHLHFEIRDRLGMGIQAGSGPLDGWINPSEWLLKHGALPP